MREVKFSHNWNNKLNNHLFTTIRRWTPEKEKYYRNLVDKDVGNSLNGKLVKIATLKWVSVEPFNKIPLILLNLDTGVFQEDSVKKLFKNFGLKDDENAIILLFESKTCLEVCDLK